MIFPRYLTEDVPVLLFTSLPLVGIGLWVAPGGWLSAGGWWKRAPFLLALWEVVLHSCLSHKEHRYIYPILPVASLYAGNCINGRVCLILASFAYFHFRFIHLVDFHQICSKKYVMSPYPSIIGSPTLPPLLYPLLPSIIGSPSSPPLLYPPLHYCIPLSPSVIVSPPPVHLVVYALLLANIPMALYFSLVHQRGTVQVMHHLRNVSDTQHTVIRY